MNDFLPPLDTAAVLADLSPANKKALFQQLGQAAQRVAGIDPALVVDRLGERERLGSTGFGAGVAIPHGKIDGLTGIVALFARLARPVDFEAVDDLPVDLVFALLSPPDAGADHLKALAGVSRRMRDRDFVAKLRGAASRDALVALLAGYGQRDAA